MKKIKNSQISLNTTNNVYRNNKKNVAIKTTIRFKILRKATTCVLTGLIATATLLSTACTPQNANMNPPNLLENTQNAGLITPRATDPTILTTESGLEIKYGNVSISPSLGSGKLAGYPYFTTNDGTKDYTWVIIGMCSIADNSSAGQAILNDSNKSLRALYGWNSSNIKTNDEIPNGCVLVKSNFGVGGGSVNYGSSGIYTNSSIGKAMNGYYTNGSFGISSIKNQIIQTQITTRDWNGSAIVFNTSNSYVFPLHGSTDGSFYILDYISGSAHMTTSTGAAYLRGVASYNTSNALCYVWMTDNSGNIWSYKSNYAGEYHPCFVMQL